MRAVYALAALVALLAAGDRAAAASCGGYPAAGAHAIKSRVEAMRLIEREASDRLIGLDIREASGVPSIVLQKSFCSGDQKFCGLKARLSCKDVRDLIASR
jgi:hypothetical protein